MDENLRYAQRGVSASKDDVHNAIKHLDKGLFPNAFCKVIPDFAGGDSQYCNIMHADTAGTKTSLAYVYWKETGDLSVWKGIAQDAIVMNIDDLICTGSTNNIVITSTIGRNKNLISGEVIKAIINGTQEFCDKLKKSGINVHFAGGETADVGDIVRTIDVGVTAFARIKRNKIIENNIQPGDVIIGLASFGQATYEDEYNSGIGCNGITSARHEVFGKLLFKKYPESYNSSIPVDLIYCGTNNLTDTLNGLPLNIGKLILSPTRTYAPVVKVILEKYHNKIKGIVHCTGGGQTKVLNFVKNVHIIKDNVFPIAPVFKLIHQDFKTSLKEMYKVFNMGSRMEIYVNRKDVNNILNVADEFNVSAQIIGRCEKNKGKKVTIIVNKKELVYV